MSDIMNMVTVGIIEREAAQLEAQMKEERDPLKKEALKKKMDERKKMALLLAIYKI